MKTPEEIKHALECCSMHIVDADCSCCEYGQESNCDAGLHLDVLGYIRRLEAERDAAVKVRDYAVLELCTAGVCNGCRHKLKNWTEEEPCMSCCRLQDLKEDDFWEFGFPELPNPHKED